MYVICNFIFVGGDDHDSYDRSSTIRDSACGAKSPFDFTSSKERIWIRFKSDSSTSDRGFVAGYVMYDSGKCCVLIIPRCYFNITLCIVDVGDMVALSG